MDTSDFKSTAANLSDREIQILRAISNGEARQSISDNLGISINTYDSYRKSIRQKLRIKSQMDWSRVLMEIAKMKGIENTPIETKNTPW